MTKNEQNAILSSIKRTYAQYLIKDSLDNIMSLDEIVLSDGKPAFSVNVFNYHNDEDFSIEVLFLNQEYNEAKEFFINQREYYISIEE